MRLSASPMGLSFACLVLRLVRIWNIMSISYLPEWAFRSFIYLSLFTVFNFAMGARKFTDRIQTPMSSSSYILHRNPDIFVSPDKFDPERWITAAERDVPLGRYLVPFTKGSRMCLGMKWVYPICRGVYLTPQLLTSKSCSDGNLQDSGIPGTSVQYGTAWHRGSRY
jgi:hypothetical protein